MNDKKATQPYRRHGGSCSIQTEDQTRHHIPLSQSLIQSKVLPLILQRQRGEEAEEEKFEASSVGS